jgi:hypothetical protein
LEEREGGIGDRQSGRIRENKKRVFVASNEKALAKGSMVGIEDQI